MIDVKSQVYKSLNKTMQDFQDINQAKIKKKTILTLLLCLYNFRLGVSFINWNKYQELNWFKHAGCSPL